MSVETKILLGGLAVFFLILALLAGRILRWLGWTDEEGPIDTVDTVGDSDPRRLPRELRNDIGGHGVDLD